MSDSNRFIAEAVRRERLLATAARLIDAPSPTGRAGPAARGALTEAQQARPDLTWTGPPSGWGDQHEAALIAGLPTLIVYVLAGKYFVRGLTAGAALRAVRGEKVGTLVS